MIARNPVLEQVENLIQELETLQPNTPVTQDWITKIVELANGLRTAVGQLLVESLQRADGYRALEERYNALAQERPAPQGPPETHPSGGQNQKS